MTRPTKRGIVLTPQEWRKLTHIVKDVDSELLKVKLTITIKGNCQILYIFFKVVLCEEKKGKKERNEKNKKIKK